MKTLIQEIDAKVKDLTKLLVLHSQVYPSKGTQMLHRINMKDWDAVGELARQIELLAKADCCYVVAIEILKELKNKTIARGIKK